MLLMPSQLPKSDSMSMVCAKDSQWTTELQEELTLLSEMMTEQIVEQ